MRMPTKQEVAQRKQIRVELQSKSIKEAMEENKERFQNWLKKRNKEEKRLKNHKTILKLLMVVEDMAEAGEFISLNIQKMKKQEENLQIIKTELARLWKERHMIKEAGEKQDS